MVFFFFSFNSLPASSKFCHLLITFANSLDPDQDQDRKSVGPDSVPEIFFCENIRTTKK